MFNSFHDFVKSFLRTTSAVKFATSVNSGWHGLNAVSAIITLDGVIEDNIDNMLFTIITMHENLDLQNEKLIIDVYTIVYYIKKDQIRILTVFSDDLKLPIDELNKKIITEVYYGKFG